jgi:hypothetical protein
MIKLEGDKKGALHARKLKLLNINDSSGIISDKPAFITSYCDKSARRWLVNIWRRIRKFI